jgi:hypothetical protein
VINVDDIDVEHCDQGKQRRYGESRCGRWGGECGPGAGALVKAALRPDAVLRRLRARPSDACTHL